MTRASQFLLVVLVGASGPAFSAEPMPNDELLKILRRVSVKRTGEVASVGESVPFPRKGAKNIEFGTRVKEGPHRLDGSLELARSRSGLELWSLRKWDDATDDSNLFTVHPKDPAKLPAGAVLQFVDNVWEYVDWNLLGAFGRSTSRLGDKAVEQFLEAWVALPNERLIYRPKNKKLYPLIPARGDYDPAAAAKVQWTVFVPMCPETKAACVYFGEPTDVCKRRSEYPPKSVSWISPYVC